ncbi:short-chain dehydrogenase [Streptomyces rimosus subsp. pseudoverticillatus]|uniref:SDR family oxidoreductase n=1 Tax=Streptomyces rimosus TaxID=1927 RepID=UPI0006B2780F|nr:SDR family oxidoreductase [Streptomyces rimosus]KOU00390.1 short-chain dehydrogenase [Streptomyces rimosus subsp. pseudoverticillatus]
MKVTVIGASGVIGSAVADEPAGRGHTVVRASRRGPVRVDVEDPASVDALFEDPAVRGADAVVCCAASGRLTPLDEPSDAEFTRGLHGKLLGQVQLTRRALHHLQDGGAVVLTGGRFDEPTPGGAFTALVNTGLDAFAQAAAPEMPRGLRLTAVSPGWVGETLERLGMAPSAGTPAAEPARTYADAVAGRTARPGTRTRENRLPYAARPATVLP